MKAAEITKRIRRHQIRNKAAKEAIQVFCRVRPLPNPDEPRCIQILDQHYIQLLCSSGRNAVPGREVRYTFKQVFDELCDQQAIFESVALPCIENVLNGKNGLIFTYGVSGSGKTFTMTGANDDAGILPRSLDVIFNSISTRQIKKCVVIPDKLNGFEIQSEEDAKAARDRLLVNKISNTTKHKSKKIEKAESDTDIAGRIKDDHCINLIEEDNRYAVFVSYVEVYNNTVYDLLEDIFEENPKPKPLQSKIIREDSNHNMFVHGANELEVGCTDEAYEAYFKGEKRKKIAETSLNSESSRSHSIFTIRVVEVPADSTGDSVLSDKFSISVSQLSLVDLAGSERTNRTKNTGRRLREAGNINNSLLSLRMCIEVMRENQKGANKIVPYRDSRLTHLFKNFFEGEGTISMVLCITPSFNDLEELLHVLKFAEMTQDVQIVQPKKTFFIRNRKRCLKRPRPEIELESQPEVESDATESNYSERNVDNIDRIVTVDVHNDPEEVMEYEANAGGDTASIDRPYRSYWFSDFPDARFIEEDDEAVLPHLIDKLEKGMEEFDTVKKSLLQGLDGAKDKFVKVIRESSDLTLEYHNLQNIVKTQSDKVISLESKAATTDTEVIKMKRKMNDLELSNQRLQNELRQKESSLGKMKLEKEKDKEAFKQKMVQEQQRLNREFERKLRSHDSALKYEMRNKDSKIKAVKRILAKDSSDSESEASSCKKVLSDPSDKEAPPSTSKLAHKTPPQSPNLTNFGVFSEPKPSKKIAVSNRRHRRSRSAGNDVWIDHRPKMHVPLSTVMQPKMPKRKSVSNLKDVKNISEVASKYCLLTQQQDSDGDLETRLYKGDVIPTAGGGAQVLFNDIEVLRQESPCHSPRPSDIRKKFEEYCSVPNTLLSPKL